MIAPVTAAGAVAGAATAYFLFTQGGRRQCERLTQVVAGGVDRLGELANAVDRACDAVLEGLRVFVEASGRPSAETPIEPVPEPPEGSKSW